MKYHRISGNIPVSNAITTFSITKSQKLKSQIVFNFQSQSQKEVKITETAKQHELSNSTSETGVQNLEL